MKNVGSSSRYTNRQSGQSTDNRQIYIDGNTVRKLEEIPQVVPRQPRRQVESERTIRRKKKKVSFQSMVYVAFIAISIAVAGGVLIGYLNLQADITNRMNHISSLQSELNGMRLANDEEYMRIMSDVNLEEIKRVAIQELGMKYAEEGQVITYTGEGSDYVRQYGSVPE